MHRADSATASEPPASEIAVVDAGWEWIVEAHGCDRSKLTNREALERLFAGIVEGMQLHPVAPATWHQFPTTGGITGLSLLSESHIACHTFPEYGSLCLNVFCCRPRPEWDFESALYDALGAASVRVRKVERPYQETLHGNWRKSPL